MVLLRKRGSPEIHVLHMLWRNLPWLRRSLLCISSIVVTNSLCDDDGGSGLFHKLNSNPDLFVFPGFSIFFLSPSSPSSSHFTPCLPGLIANFYQ